MTHNEPNYCALKFLTPLALGWIVFSIPGDYINSKEYRKPEWVTRMEEIQKRLSGKLKAQSRYAHFIGHSPSFVFYPQNKSIRPSSRKRSAKSASRRV